MLSTADDYKPRTIEQLAEEALAILRNHPGQPLGCGYIGEQLFPDAIHRGSAPFARIAGKVMRHLERSGRASYGRLRERGSYGWHVV